MGIFRQGWLPKKRKNEFIQCTMSQDQGGCFVKCGVEENVELLGVKF